MNEISLYNVCDFIEKSGTTLILGHYSPDGDCLGSAFALAEMIRMCGGQAEVGCDGKVPERLMFMCDGVLTPDTVNVGKFDSIISVDVASPSQLGGFDTLIPKIALMIDHHGMGEPFADNYIDSSAAAAGEIVYRIYKELLFRGSIKQNPRTLRFIYAAIVSDCGSFKFSNTTPSTMAVGAELLANINNAHDGGLSTSDISRLLFGRFSVREMTAKMVAIQNMRFYENGRMCAVMFSSEILKQYGLDESDIGNAVDTPRCIDGVLVALSVRQTGEKSYKVSSRANVDIDCAAVCAQFGGGGHTRAAGCSLEADTPEDALETAAEAFGNAVREYAEKITDEKARI